MPISTVGDRLLWKKAQKKEIKKNTSEVINKIIPHRMPFETDNEWSPCIVLSRVMSRHHWCIVNRVIKIPIKNKFILNIWNHFTIPEVRIKVPRAPVKGQGLMSTRWYGWLALVI